MEHKIITKSKGNMAFVSSIENHDIVMDAHKEFGGNDEGPSPKQLLLSALSGCTGMDVVSLLKKMRVEYDDFHIEVTGTLTEDHPKYYNKINLEYSFVGSDLNKAKIEKAVNLSQERYCGVSYMLGQAAKLTYNITINEPAETN